jgi:RNA 2',3'-cyclic 3'-phosphodiesterase
MKTQPPLRLFLALYPPPLWAAAASTCLPTAALPSGRSTPAEQMHLTLAFLGDRREKDLPHIRESIEAGAKGIRSFDVQTTGLALLPEAGPLRLIAASLSLPPQLAELQRRLSKRLTVAKPKRRDDAFTPHITLYRFTNEQAAPGAREAVTEQLPPIYLPTFRPAELCLVASVLHPLGARHRVIERIAFPIIETQAEASEQAP